MDASDVERGFRLGDWVVEPRLGRMSGLGRSHALAPHHLVILRTLASRHGEVVGREALRELAWPGAATDEVLRTSIRELRHLLGDSPKDVRYIVPVGRSGYTLIAPVEPLAQLAAAMPASPREVIVAESRVITGAQKFVAAGAPSRVQGARRLPARDVDTASGGGDDVRAAAFPGLVDDRVDHSRSHRHPDRRHSRLGLRDHARRDRPRFRRCGAAATAASATRDGTGAGDRRRADGRRDRLRLVAVHRRRAANVRRHGGTVGAIRGGAAARRHDCGWRKRVSRRRFRRGDLRSAGADSGPARRGAHFGVRVQGPATRRAQDWQRAWCPQCPRGERASRRRQTACDCSADRRIERLSRLGWHLRSRLGRRDRHPGRHFAEDHAGVCGSR